MGEAGLECRLWVPQSLSCNWYMPLGSLFSERIPWAAVLRRVCQPRRKPYCAVDGGEILCDACTPDDKSLHQCFPGSFQFVLCQHYQLDPKNVIGNTAE